MDTATGTHTHPTRASERRPLVVFASSSDDERRRSPSDVLSLLAGALLVLWGALAASQQGAFLTAVTDTITALPGWIDSLIASASVVAAIYAVGLLVVTVAARDRLGLLRDLLVAIAVTVLASFLLGRLRDGAWPEVAALWQGGRGGLPIAGVAVLTAVVQTAAPHLVRPARRFGYLLIILVGLAAVAAGPASAADILVAWGSGLGIAAIVHLVSGSPAGAPSHFRVREALARVGLPVGALQTMPGSRGALRLGTVDDRGRELTVVVYGRDAADCQVVAKTWRSLWYRDQPGPLSVSRAQQVEHEALLLLLAQRAGVTGGELVTTATTASGDHMLVVAPHIRPGQRVPIGAEHLDRSWHELLTLHKARISFGWIDPRRVAAAADGAVQFDDWSAATSEADEPALLADIAAMLVLTACSVGANEACVAALRNVEVARLADAVAYVQPAALTPALRRTVKQTGLDLGVLRTTIAEMVGTRDVELVQLQRVRLVNLLLMLVAGLAAFFVVSRVIDIGLNSIVETFEGAIWGWLAVALIVGQLNRLSDAWAALGACDEPLPYGPTVGLELAVSFINLAVPCTAARISIETRFYQRQGIPTAKALTFGALAGLSLFVVQVTVLLATTLFGTSSLDFSNADTSTVTGVVRKLALLAVVGLLVGLLVVVLTRRLREWVGSALRQALEALHGMQSIRRWGPLLGGNLITQVLLSWTLGFCVLAFGYHVSFVDLMVTTVVVSLFAGLMPVPGGIGVSEFALTACLVAIGVPQAAAVSAVITYRLVTYYLPPLWGYFALRWMRSHEYL